MRALVIEDNKDIADCIGQSLTSMGFACDCFSEGKFLESASAVAEFDIIVLDLNLPDMDGLAALKTYRDSGGSTPVLIISARISTGDKVMGLDLGADDYLVKPFALDEFEARIRALLRREAASKSTRLEFGDLVYHQTTREVSAGGESLNLSPRELAALEVLITRAGSITSKQHIANHIFSFDDAADTSSVEIYIHRIRKKLSSSRVSIVTRRGLGYALKTTDVE